MNSKSALPTLVLVVICIVFAALAWSGRFIQDDAYITLAYARNVVDGHGLVFNVGENVEGFTSLIWTLLAAGMMSVGIRDVATALQVVGIATSVLALIPTYRISRRILAFANAEHAAWLALAAPLFIASTAAVQYWSASAMEAPFFWLLIVLTLEAFLAAPNSNRWVAIGMLALLTRPEAMLLVSVLLAARLVAARTLTANPTEPRSHKPLYREILLQGALLGGTLFALTAWRWFSYDALLPNTFAAKTGFLADQLASGVQYLHEHLLNVWMYVGLIPVVFACVKIRNREVRLLAVLAGLWMLAVVYLGGDVLHHQRFLIPAQIILATLLPAGCYLLFARRTALAAAGVVAVSIGAFVMERDGIEATSSIEQQLVMKMRRTGEWLKRSAAVNDTTYTVAATTIGALKYFSQQTVIDMLGLTDRTIATQPVIIPEVSNDTTVTWKERKYNADYVLSRKPDFIVFSTGIKPSAFAERALWARQMYVEYFVYYYKTPRSPNLTTMFRRKPREVIERSPQQRVVLTPSQLHALLLYPQAVSLVSTNKPSPEAEQLFRRIAEEGPANYGQPYQFIADNEMVTNRPDSALVHFNRAVEIDPGDIRSHHALFQIYRHKNDSASAQTHLDWVLRCNPVLLTQLGINVPEEATYR